MAARNPAVPTLIKSDFLPNAPEREDVDDALVEADPDGEALALGVGVEDALGEADPLAVGVGTTIDGMGLCKLVN